VIAAWRPGRSDRGVLRTPGAHGEARIVRAAVAAVALLLGAYCLIAAATALDAAPEQPDPVKVAAPRSRAPQEPPSPLAVRPGGAPVRAR
jgi:hypothetical protein